MSKRVVITCDPDGGIEVEAFGFEGNTCEEATAFLDELFGDPEEKTLKDEYYQGTTVAKKLPSGYCG